MPVSWIMIRHYRSAYSAYNADVELLVQYLKEDEATRKVPEAEDKGKYDEKYSEKQMYEHAERSRTAHQSLRWTIV